MRSTPEQRTAFGARLRELREAKPATVQAVVDDLRRHDPTMSVAKLSAWERGEYAPSKAATIELLEDYYKVPGELTARLGAAGPPAATELDLLRQRVEAIEAHLGIGTKVRHLRAADAPKASDPGRAKGRTSKRPTGARPEAGS